MSGADLSEFGRLGDIDLIDIYQEPASRSFKGLIRLTYDMPSCIKV